MPLLSADSTCILNIHHTLQEVDVRGNNLSDNGAMIVGRSMRQMQTTVLTRLDLGYNEIEDDGAFTIANVRFILQDSVLPKFIHCCTVLAFSRNCCMVPVPVGLSCVGVHVS